MKNIKGSMIIVFLSFLGELCKHYIPLYVPGSIYGLIMLVILLYFKVIKTEDIEQVAGFLFVIFPVIFIPSATKIIDIFPEVRQNILKLLFIIIFSTVVSMIVTVKITDNMISARIRKREIEDERNK